MQILGGMRCETKFLPAAEGTPCDDNKVSLSQLFCLCVCLYVRHYLPCTT